MLGSGFYKQRPSRVFYTNSAPGNGGRGEQTLLFTEDVQTIQVEPDHLVRVSIGRQQRPTQTEREKPDTVP